MKLKLWSALLCSGLIVLFQPTQIRAQDTAPPPAPQQPPAQQTTQQQAPAPPVAVRVEDHDTGGDEWSIEPLFWLTKKPPVLKLGFASQQPQQDPTTGLITPAQTTNGGLDYPGGSKYGYGGLITIPTRHENSVQVSYFRVAGDGSTTLPKTSIFFGNTFPAADYVTTAYKIENYKVSFNYLSYPYPSNGSKFRLKTLWELQYLRFSSTIAAPLDVNAISTDGNKQIILPTVGLGIEYHPSKHVYLEAKASGMAIWHHMDIWDTEASLVVKFGRVEGLIGGKAYHFKTTPKADQYFSDTLYGPTIGLRYVFLK